MDVPLCWRVTELFQHIKDTDDALIDVTGRNWKGINSPSTQTWENLTARVLFTAGRFAENDAVPAIWKLRFVFSVEVE